MTDIVAIVREFFDYDAETGKLHRRVIRGFYGPDDEVGFIGAGGYRMTKIGNLTTSVHRCVWAINTGEWPTYKLFFVDGDKTNTRFENLSRKADHRKRTSVDMPTLAERTEAPLPDFDPLWSKLEQAVWMWRKTCSIVQVTTSYSDPVMRQALRMAEIVHDVPIGNKLAEYDRLKEMERQDYADRPVFNIMGALEKPGKGRYATARTQSAVHTIGPPIEVTHGLKNL